MEYLIGLLVIWAILKRVGKTLGARMKMLAAEMEEAASAQSEGKHPEQQPRQSSPRDGSEWKDALRTLKASSEAYRDTLAEPDPASNQPKRSTRQRLQQDSGQDASVTEMSGIDAFSDADDIGVYDDHHALDDGSPALGNAIVGTGEGQPGNGQGGRSPSSRPPSASGKGASPFLPINTMRDAYRFHVLLSPPKSQTPGSYSSQYRQHRD